MRLLILEDDPQLGEALAVGLRQLRPCGGLVPRRRAGRCRHRRRALRRAGARPGPARHRRHDLAAPLAPERPDAAGADPDRARRRRAAHRRSGCRRRRLPDQADHHRRTGGAAARDAAPCLGPRPGGVDPWRAALRPGRQAGAMAGPAGRPDRARAGAAGDAAAAPAARAVAHAAAGKALRLERRRAREQRAGGLRAPPAAQDPPRHRAHRARRGLCARRGRRRVHESATPAAAVPADLRAAGLGGGAAGVGAAARATRSTSCSTPRSSAWRGRCSPRWSAAPRPGRRCRPRRPAGEADLRDLAIAVWNAAGPAAAGRPRRRAAAAPRRCLGLRRHAARRRSLARLLPAVAARRMAGGRRPARLRTRRAGVGPGGQPAAAVAAGVAGAAAGHGLGGAARAAAGARAHQRVAGPQRR